MPRCNEVVDFVTDTVLDRINDIDVNTPPRRLFGVNNLVRAVEALNNDELDSLAAAVRRIARRIRRAQVNGTATRRELRRLQRIAARRLAALQQALIDLANS